MCANLKGPSLVLVFRRTQVSKLSASGQSVGGDMLVGRRVGFSGTPSDLLPLELGKCEYETGDDGKMLTVIPRVSFLTRRELIPLCHHCFFQTVQDPAVVSYELLADKWDVPALLLRIATADEPRFHALIDTGALVTGYSNEEVAAELLKLGLAWCEGVVFLDAQDKQQVG